MRVNSFKDKGFNIEFIYSPLFEMLCSLHVLIKPDHHLERTLWAEEMKGKLPNKLYKDLMEFGMKTEEWCVVMDVCNLYEECDDFNMMEALYFLESLEVKSFNTAFLKYKNSKDNVFTNKLKKEMVIILKEYYLSYFERELRFIEPLLIRCLKRQSEVCMKQGIYSYADEIHSRIEVTDKAFLFHKYTLFTIPFDTINRILVRISSFISPHLLMDYGENMVQFTATAHLSEGIDNVPMDLVKLMKALSDETRLKIIRKLYGSKQSTQSLSEELKLTEACISKHLKLLYEAELLHKERCGNYIYYYLNTFYIDRIPLSLYEYLDI